MIEGFLILTALAACGFVYLVYKTRRALKHGVPYYDVVLARMYNGVVSQDRPGFIAVVKSDGSEIARIEKNEDMEVEIVDRIPWESPQTRDAMLFYDSKGNAYNIIGKLGDCRGCGSLRIKFSHI